MKVSFLGVGTRFLPTKSPCYHPTISTKALKGNKHNVTVEII